MFCEHAHFHREIVCFARSRLRSSNLPASSHTCSDERHHCKVQVFTPAHGTPIRIKRHTAVATRRARSINKGKTSAIDDVSWIIVAVLDFKECHVGVAQCSNFHEGLILLAGSKPNGACQRGKQHWALFQNPT